MKIESLDKVELSLAEVAFHESGHAVTAAVMGDRVYAAAVVTILEFGGSVWHNEFLSDFFETPGMPRRWRYLVSLIVDMAGAEAHREYLRVNGYPADDAKVERGAGTDLKNAAKHARALLIECTPMEQSFRFARDSVTFEVRGGGTPQSIDRLDEALRAAGREFIAANISAESIERCIFAARTIAKQIITDNWERVERIADMLIVWRREVDSILGCSPDRVAKRFIELAGLPGWLKFEQIEGENDNGNGNTADD